MTMTQPDVPIRTDWLERWALYAPDRIAIDDLDAGRSVTYAEAARIVHRTARWFRDEHGIAAGERVAVLAPNALEYVLLFFAVQRLGAVLVPVNWRLAPREVAHVVTDAAPALVVVDASFADKLDGADVSTVDFAELQARMHDDSLPSDLDVPEPDFDAACMILYTSGTTGAPKGAVLTNRGIFWNSVNTGLRLNLTEADRTAIFAPLFHTGGWHVLTTPVIHHGGTLLLTGFDPDRVLRLCDERGLTILFGVPTMLAMMHDTPAFAEVSLGSVRYAIVGGEPMPKGLIRAWHAKGVPIRQGYGLTEFGPNVFSLPERDAERKAGSIGFPNFYIDARVVDDGGRELAADEIGELVLRGPAVMAGYWRNPEATAETLRDGWLHTGDLVRRDAEGYFYVVGRKKEMFISGAENVYPAEVEGYLQTHPAVKAVAVVGVPDERWGEVGKAFVVLHDGAALDADALLAFARTGLAKYKVPKHVAFLDALPTSDSGKVLKRALRESELPA
ncbi:MAG: AMP-binding protein [Rhodothermales bacterium]